MSKKLVGLTIILSIIIASIQGCAGKSANPVSEYQPYDNDLSCQSIMYSMQDIDQNVRRMLPASNKTGKNVALGITGAILFWPALLFMDFSNAEKVEIQAYKRRYERLSVLYNQKHCSKK